MSKVEELLMKYNPEGVNNIPLWELTAWDKKFNAVDKSMQKKVIKYKYYLAKDLDALVDDTGDIRILYTNEKVAYTSEEKCNGNICEGEIVAIPWGGTPTVKYYNGKFVTGDNRIATSLDTKILNNKYLFYWMISQLGTIADFYRGAGIQHPSMISVLTMQIPLPHIKVQEEIVKILDSFTNLIDALNEELSLRQKQFEYYREKLLTFDDKIEFDTIKLVHIDDICNVSRGASPRPIKNYLTQSEEGVPWIKIGDVTPFDKYIKKTNERITKEGAKKSRFLHKGDLILSNSLSFGRPYILEIDGCIHDGWISLSGFENYVLRDFLYEVLNTKSVQNYWTMKANNGGAMSNLNSDIVKSTIIKIPSIKVQEDIVKILDSFTNLISSLKEEIALRQKQYEYYREKLLTFD